MHRREFVQRLTGTTTLAGVILADRVQAPAQGVSSPGVTTRSPMSLCLSCGSIGVKANQLDAIELARRHGFDAVEPYLSYLATLSPDQVATLVADLKANSLRWGAAGLPVDFRRDDASFRKDLEGLPGLALAGQRAGVTRVGTWISPAHPTLTYLRNFKQHAQRLREVAVILQDHGQWLGLEYVGTQSGRAGAKNPFIHSLAETQDLIGEIGTGNVGIVLDSWHWWQADDTVADLRALRAIDVVSVDLNDAPVGVAKDQQRDGQRELPAATGVIDVQAFLGALRAIGYDGPVRAEPFNQRVNELDNDAACAATITALHKAITA